MISMGNFILGMKVESRLQKRLQASITMEKPAKISRLKGKAFLNPNLLALDKDRMLFGPGVTAVIIA